MENFVRKDEMRLFDLRSQVWPEPVHLEHLSKTLSRVASKLVQLWTREQLKNAYADRVFEDRLVIGRALELVESTT